MKKLKYFLTKRSFLFKLRLILGLIILILVLGFLYLKIVPFGRITYSRQWPRGLASGKGFFYDFKPAERIDSAVVDSLKIIADPIYFSLFTPRRFDHATVKIKYRDRLGTVTPIIEVGLLEDKLSGAYDFQPLQNNVLDHWRFSWPRLEDTDKRLILQASLNYSSPAEFDRDLISGNLQDCPPGEPTACVAVYNYPLAATYRLPDYSPLKPLTINQPLRGAHQFYIYLNGSWRLGFNFSDLDQDAAVDPITVRVMSGDKVVAAQSLVDAAPVASGRKSPERELILRGDDAPAGVYKVEIKASDDIVISKIDSSSDKLSFISRIWPVSGAGNLTIFTDATNLEAQTFSPASLEPINFGGQDFVFDKTYQQFDLVAGSGVNKIKLKKDDIILAGNGVFSFASGSLFDPGFKKVDRYFSPGDGIRYIIADYQRPLGDEDWKTAEAEFDLKEAHRENGKYTFLISVPGLKAEDGTDDFLEIKEIEVELTGKTLRDKLFGIN
ncbi:MAG: hypothetical protein WC458_01220 [Patescibacteria group bacterium]